LRVMWLSSTAASVRSSGVSARVPLCEDKSGAYGHTHTEREGGEMHTGRDGIALQLDTHNVRHSRVHVTRPVRLDQVNLAGTHQVAPKRRVVLET
jgi:hypothetical protein